MRIKFRNPPIDALVIGSYFPPILQLQAQHVGSFWASVLDTFPRCSQHLPLGEWIQAQDEPMPMPRFWLITQDDSRLIQIQKNAFIANWRNRPNVEYPHYVDVKHFFEEYLAKFNTFLTRTIGAEIREVLNLELMYTNFLTMDGLKVFSDLVRLVPGIDAPKLPEGVNNIIAQAQMQGSGALEKAEILIPDNFGTVERNLWSICGV